MGNTTKLHLNLSLFPQNTPKKFILTQCSQILRVRNYTRAIYYTISVMTLALLIVCDWG